MHPPVRALLAAAATAAALAACTSEPPAAGGSSPAPTRTTSPSGPATSAPPTTPTPSRSAGPTTSPAPASEPGPVVPGDVSTVASGLQAPWGLAFLPDGDALVSERDSAQVKRVTPDGEVRTVGEVPGVVPGGEGGLMGLAVSPGFAQDRYVYAYLTAADDNRVVRMRYTADGLGEPEVVLDGIAKAQIHDGGRIRFGPDGMLYVGTGDASEPDRSQDSGSRNGKVLRVLPDGSVPDDNPFPGSPVFTSGHRNVQGLAFDDEGRLFAAEFGQNQIDELNVLTAGANYGWPEVEGSGGAGDFTDPVTEWSPTSTSSPSGIAYLRDTVFVAALAGERLFAVPVDGAEAGEPSAALTDLGRIRTVEPAPDGSLWVTTSNTDGRGDVRDGDDRILRVEVEPA